MCCKAVLVGYFWGFRSDATLSKSVVSEAEHSCVSLVCECNAGGRSTILTWLNRLALSKSSSFFLYYTCINSSTQNSLFQRKKANSLWKYKKAHSYITSTHQTEQVTPFCINSVDAGQVYWDVWSINVFVFHFHMLFISHWHLFWAFLCEASPVKSFFNGNLSQLQRLGLVVSLLLIHHFFVCMTNVCIYNRLRPYDTYKRHFPWIWYKRFTF